MRNFIRYNIDNVKGSRKPASIIDKGDHSTSPNKKSLSQSRPQAYRQPNIHNKVQRLED